MSHPGFVFAQHLTGLQPPQDVIDDLTIHMKRRDVATHILLTGVSQKIEFGLVYSEDRPIRPHPVQPD